MEYASTYLMESCLLFMMYLITPMVQHSVKLTCEKKCKIKQSNKGQSNSNIYFQRSNFMNDKGKQIIQIEVVCLNFELIYE
jgi:hypothetical protein